MAGINSIVISLDNENEVSPNLTCISVIRKITVVLVTNIRPVDQMFDAPLFASDHFILFELSRIIREMFL